MKPLLPLIVLALALLLTGCGLSPYRNTPRYLPPETRSRAAVQLNAALAGADRLSEIWATEFELNWHERVQLSAKRWLIVPRNLQYEAIRVVGRAHKAGEFYELVLYADGGDVTFRFRDGLKAAKAEAALIRLRQTAA